jgi:hypothetical protein
MGRLAGNYRYQWATNQLLLRLGAGAIRSLSQAGIETIVLKGAALGATHYRDPGMRPMVDFDVLVPRDRAVDAVTALESGGLGPHPDVPPPRERIPVHHSTPMVGPGGHELDLHWYALWRSSPDEDLWAGSVPLEVAGQHTRVLCPPHQLLQTVCHSTWFNLGWIHWIADAMVVLRGEETFDWPRLVQAARARQLGPMLVSPFSYLREAFGAPIPNETISELGAQPAARLEGRFLRAARSPATARNFLLIQLDRYQRLKRLDPGAPRASSFPAQLRAWLGQDTYRGAAVFSLRRILRRRRGDS